MNDLILAYKNAYAFYYALQNKNNIKLYAWARDYVHRAIVNQEDFIVLSHGGKYCFIAPKNIVLAQDFYTYIYDGNEDKNIVDFDNNINIQPHSTLELKELSKDEIKINSFCFYTVMFADDNTILNQDFDITNPNHQEYHEHIKIKDFIARTKFWVPSTLNLSSKDREYYNFSSSIEYQTPQEWEKLFHSNFFKIKDNSDAYHVEVGDYILCDYGSGYKGFRAIGIALSKYDEKRGGFDIVYLRYSSLYALAKFPFNVFLLAPYSSSLIYYYLMLGDINPNVFRVDYQRYNPDIVYAYHLKERAMPFKSKIISLLYAFNMALINPQYPQVKQLILDQYQKENHQWICAYFLDKYWYAPYTLVSLFLAYKVEDLIRYLYDQNVVELSNEQYIADDISAYNTLSYILSGASNDLNLEHDFTLIDNAQNFKLEFQALLQNRDNQYEFFCLNNFNAADNQNRKYVRVGATSKGDANFKTYASYLFIGRSLVSADWSDLYINGMKSLEYGDLIYVPRYDNSIRAIGIVTSHCQIDDYAHYAGEDGENTGDISYVCRAAYFKHFADVAWLYFHDQIKHPNINSLPPKARWQVLNHQDVSVRNLKLFVTKNKSDSQMSSIDKEGRGELFDECVFLLEHNKNLILNGAPGCGKTYLAYQLALHLTSNDQSKIARCQFHPSYDYSDFIEGLRPVKDSNSSNITFERQDGVFKAFCKQAIQCPHQESKFVFIIDEINRGDLGKIFGEAFTLIESNYRGANCVCHTPLKSLILDSSDAFFNGFYIPENVYIIGTMNDIDRSVESIDFALRRRFVWKEIKCNDNLAMLDSLGEYRDFALRKMQNLNQALSEQAHLNSHYHIGGAYFMLLKNYLHQDINFALEKLWQYHLYPVIYEYIRHEEKVEELMLKLKACLME